MNQPFEYHLCHNIGKCKGKEDECNARPDENNMIVDEFNVTYEPDKYEIF